MELDKTLLSIDEFCSYVGIGKTKAREMISNPCCKYVVRIGRRVFVHKELFDEELKKNAKYQLTMWLSYFIEEIMAATVTKIRLEFDA